MAALKIKMLEIEIWTINGTSRGFFGSTRGTQQGDPGQRKMWSRAMDLGWIKVSGLDLLKDLLFNV